MTNLGLGLTKMVKSSIGLCYIINFHFFFFFICYIVYLFISFSPLDLGLTMVGVKPCRLTPTIDFII